MSSKLLLPIQLGNNKWGQDILEAQSHLLHTNKHGPSSVIMRVGSEATG